MKLYHGGYMKVREPKIIEHNRAVDFGIGFYTTSNLEQAKSWACRVSKNIKQTPIVSIYEFNDMSELSTLLFEKPDSKWLDFVSNNRNMVQQEVKYDLVIGPVANDDVFLTLQAYFTGIIDKGETLKRLKIKKLFDQYVFKSSNSLKFLEFTGSQEVKADAK